jgi:hypothetical protein
MRPKQPQFSPKDLFKSEGAFAASLLVAAIDVLTVEMFGWSPETIEVELSEYAGADIPQRCMDKLMAAMYIANSNEFWTSLPTFVDLVNVLNDDLAPAGTWDIATTKECAWAISEALLIAEPEHFDPNDRKTLLNKDIRGYIQQMMKREGYDFVPAALSGYIEAPDVDDARFFSEDPMMYETFSQISDEKTKSIDHYVRERLLRLNKQIDTLTLINRIKEEDRSKERSEEDILSVVQRFHTI